MEEVQEQGKLFQKENLRYKKKLSAKKLVNTWIKLTIRNLNNKNNIGNLTCEVYKTEDESQRSGNNNMWVCRGDWSSVISPSIFTEEKESC